MRIFFLTSTTLLTWASLAAAQSITPGQGSLTDAKGNVWTITTNGSIREGDAWTPGGGGTAALTIVDGVVYGQDSGHGPVNPGGWFTLSDGEGWTPSAAPNGAATVPTQAIATPTAAAVTTAAVAPPTVCGSVAPSGSFHVAGGQIIGPDGNSFIARGVNVYDDLATGDFDAIVAMFPGVNFIRIGMHSYSDPGSWDGIAQKAAARGTVLEFENHPDGGGGQDSGPPGGIGAESAWYGAMASHFANNPYIWFGTFNEPKGVENLSSWQQSTYQAVRSTGNNNIVMVYVGGELGVLQPSVYAGMTNIAYDDHYYGGGGSPDTDPVLSGSIDSFKPLTSADGVVPVIIGEYGDSMDGTNIDSNWQQAVASVINRGSSGQNGSAAWAFNPGGNADRLQSGGALTAYGQMVALYINTDVIPCTPAQTAANAKSTLVAVTAQATPDTQPPANPETPAATLPSPDTSAQAQIDAADAAIAQANAILAKLKSQ